MQLSQLFSQYITESEHMSQDYKGFKITVKDGEKGNLLVFVGDIDFTRSDKKLDNVGAAYREGKRIVDEMIKDAEEENRAHKAFADKHQK
jgi:hypothetical protein